MIYAVWVPAAKDKTAWIHRAVFKRGRFMDERSLLSKGQTHGAYPGFQFSKDNLLEVAEVIKTCACGNHVYGMENGKKQKA